MQERRHDGTLGNPEEYSPDKLDKALKKKNVKSVEVFEGTPENIDQRKRKAYRANLRVKNKRFNKNGK